LHRPLKLRADTRAPFASDEASSISPAIVRSSARSISSPSTRIFPLTVLAWTSPDTPLSSISPLSVFAHHAAALAFELDRGVHRLEIGLLGRALHLDRAVRGVQLELAGHVLGAGCRR
jgi:hypothetical protein